MTAYCLKCRKKVEIMSPKMITFKNGSPATQGVCPICLTKVYRFESRKLSLILEKGKE